jgi:hypothetical protein
MGKKRKPEELTEEELEQADGEPLPDREAMSVIRGPGEYPLPSETYPIPTDPPKPVIPLNDPTPGG